MSILDRSEPRASMYLGPAGNRPHLTVLIPVYNERESLEPLFASLFPVLERMKRSFEIIAIDDGSRDGTMDVLRKIAARRPEVKIVSFRRNAGQTAAIMAGIDHASGQVLVSIDADLQNDPEDIPALLSRLDEGFDVVSGWRKDRKDAPFSRNFVSRVANRLISRISGVKLNDYGCTLKAYRRHVIKGVRLYGEMHRFIPIYASWQGATVTEIPVNHRVRRFGQSKYGLERVVKVLLDLLVVKFLDRYFVKPIYLFGGFGLLSLMTAFLSLLYMLYLKYAEGLSMIQTPMPVLSAMFVLVGLLSCLMGLLAEILVRTYFESQQRSAYLIAERVNFDNNEDDTVR
jgi:glycosyltransferase involved in cell wall biosynthesis